MAAGAENEQSSIVGFGFQRGGAVTVIQHPLHFETFELVGEFVGHSLHELGVDRVEFFRR